MKLIILMSLILLPSCVSAMYGKEIQVEDCVTRHLKVIGNKQAPSGDLYEKIVDSCKTIYTGRP